MKALTREKEKKKKSVEGKERGTRGKEKEDLDDLLVVDFVDECGRGEISEGTVSKLTAFSRTPGEDEAEGGEDSLVSTSTGDLLHLIVNVKNESQRSCGLLRAIIRVWKVLADRVVTERVLHHHTTRSGRGR